MISPNALDTTDAPIDERLLLFGIDDAVRQSLRGMRPDLDADLPVVNARVRAALEKAKTFKVVTGAHVDNLLANGSRHVQILFAADFGPDYLASAKQTADLELTLGLGARSRITYMMAIIGQIIRRRARKNVFRIGRFAREIGAVIRAVMLDCSIAMAMHERAASVRVAHRQGDLDQAVDIFSHSADETVAFLQAGATQLTSNTSQLDLDMRKAQDRAGHARQSLEEVTVATGDTVSTAELLDRALTRIRDHAVRGAELNRRTTDSAKQADASIIGLVKAAESINAVAATIRAVANQTNLLALNATIEAARAGEAGRGFSIVAGEVKALALQTGFATEQVAQHIEAISSASKSSIAALERALKSVSEQQSLTEEIERVVMDQGRTTAVFQANASQVAEAMQVMHEDMLLIEQTLQQTSDTMTKTKSFTEDVSKISSDFLGDLRGFLQKIKRI